MLIYVKGIDESSMFVASEVIPLLRSKVSVKIVDLYSSRKVIATIQESDSIYLFQVRRWHASCGAKTANHDINNVDNVSNDTNTYRNVDNDNDNNDDSNNDNNIDNDNDNDEGDNDEGDNDEGDDDNDNDIESSRDSAENCKLVPIVPEDGNKIEVEVEVEVDIESTSELTSPLSLLSTEDNDVNIFSKGSPIGSKNRNENGNKNENSNENENENENKKKNHSEANCIDKCSEVKKIEKISSSKNNRIINRREDIEVKNSREEDKKQISKEKDKDVNSKDLGPVDSTTIPVLSAEKMVKEKKICSFFLCSTPFYSIKFKFYFIE